MAQDHTFLGKRGDTLVEGVTLNDLYKIVHDRIYYACKSIQLKQSVDPDAVAQNFCCEVEKKMGVYPNATTSNGSDRRS